MKTKLDLAESKMKKAKDKYYEKEDLEERRQRVINYYYNKERKFDWMGSFGHILLILGFIMMFVSAWFLIIFFIGLTMLFISGENKRLHKEAIAERLGI